MDFGKSPGLSGHRSETGSRQRSGADGASAGAKAGGSPDKARPEGHPHHRSDSQKRQAKRQRKIGPEIWLSLLVGIILMLVGWEFARWTITSAQGTGFDASSGWRAPEQSVGTESSWDIQGHQALMNSAVFLFGLAMVIEAAALTMVMIFPRTWRPGLMGTLFVTVIMTLYNVVAFFALLQGGRASFISLVAIAFGGYMAMMQYGALKRGVRVAM